MIRLNLDDHVGRKTHSATMGREADRKIDGAVLAGVSSFSEGHPWASLQCRLVQCRKRRLLSASRTPPTLTLPLEGGGNYGFTAVTYTSPLEGEVGAQRREGGLAGSPQRPSSAGTSLSNRKARYASKCTAFPPIHRSSAGQQWRLAQA